MYEDTVQASWASRHMLLTGLVILAFVIYHLLHFTFGVTDPRDYKYRAASVYGAPRTRWLNPELDVAAMVVRSFEKPVVSIAYIVAMLVLGLHLWHGAGSWLQSLGLKNRRTLRLIDGLGAAVRRSDRGRQLFDPAGDFAGLAAFAVTTTRRASAVLTQYLARASG